MMEVLKGEFVEAYLDPGPPYVPGTCYPLRRWNLLHAAEHAAIKSLPNPYRKALAPSKEKDGSPE